MKNQRRVMFTAALAIVLGLVAISGYRFWYEPTYDFFSTDDATVTGALVRVAAPSAGQIVDLFVEVGDTVTTGGALATIKVVSAAPNGTTAAPAVPRVLARVTSPIAGSVAARGVSVGDTIATGQAIVTMVDLNQLWVVANVDETRAGEIRAGQSADIAISAANRIFHGKVAEIGSATTEVTAASSMIAVTSSSDTKKVPVRIVFDYAGARLVTGMSATATIYTHGAPIRTGMLVRPTSAANCVHAALGISKFPNFSKTVSNAE